MEVPERLLEDERRLEVPGVPERCLEPRGTTSLS